MSRHYQRGATLPETALVIGVVLMLMFGIIDFSRYMYTYGFVANAARQGARWAMVRGSLSCTNAPNLPSACHMSGSGNGKTGASSSDVQSYVQSLSVGLTNQPSITAAASWTTCTPLAASGAMGNDPGCIVAVQVSYPFKFILPYLPGPTYTMTSTSKMIITQ